MREASPVGTALGEERHQRVDVARCYQPAIRSPGEHGENTPGARLFRAPGFRSAHEDSLLAFTLADARRVEGTTHEHVVHRVASGLPVSRVLGVGSILRQESSPDRVVTRR